MLFRSVKRFVGLMGDIEIGEVTQGLVDQFKAKAKEKDWKAWTIKGTVKDIRTLTRHFCGTTFPLGVRVPSPNPDPTPLEVVDAIWKPAPLWLRQWIVLDYWTCMRLDDSLRLIMRVQAGELARAENMIQWTAEKTGKEHSVPVPDWLRQWLNPVAVPFHQVNDHAQDVVRAALAKCSESAGVSQVYPRNLRQRALTEWKRSSPDAGSIIHGSGLGVLDHYVPAIEVLSAAMHRVRLPSCFGVTVDDSEVMLSAWRRLDPAAQKLVGEMTVRMAK